MLNESTNQTVQRIFAIRDTAIGKDIATGIFAHDGEAAAWLANYCVALKRVSFELYKIACIEDIAGEMRVTPVVRSYVCSANLAVLESYNEHIEDLLNDEETDD